MFVITKILAIALALALCAAGVQTWRVKGLQSKVAQAEAANDQLSANLTAQAEAVTNLRKAADEREAAGKRAIAKAQQEARKAHRNAQTILALPKPTGDECAAASALIRRELGK